MRLMYLFMFGFTDGLSLPVPCLSDPISQATKFNGCHHDTMVKRFLNVMALSKLLVNL